MVIELLSQIARAGGGGSSGGGGGAVGILVIPALIIGAVASWWIRKRRIEKAKARQSVALQTDKTWADDVIVSRAKEVFNLFQADWSNFNYESMKNYLTPRYYNHIYLMLVAMYQMGRRNEVADVQISSVVVFDIKDHRDDELDIFSVEIKASAQDKLFSSQEGRVLRQRNEAFEEIWNFERENGIWMLDSISQVNRDSLVVSYRQNIDAKYLDFATRNGFYYNADFGWLLMPMKGILFSDASYGMSDINHHVIGAHSSMVVQFFEYVPLVREKATWKDNLKTFYQRRQPLLAKYVIAHVQLPKDYANILVLRRNSFNFFAFRPPNLHQVTLEWAKFNKTFDVYAADVDRVNSLELLHPVFMEKLVSLPYRTNIEIVGRDLYLYSTDKNANYDDMLLILKSAFEEMKM